MGFLKQNKIIEKCFSGKLVDEFQHVDWAGDGLVAVVENDIYLVENISSREDVIPLTKTGSEYLFNGVTHGVYQSKYRQDHASNLMISMCLENILQRKDAVWISRDSSQMVFATFDYSNVSRIPVLPTQSGEDSKQDSFFFEKVSKLWF